MQSSKLPASLKDVAGPLDEAARYERLALERRKGLFGLFSACVLALVFAWKVLGGSFSFNVQGIAMLVVVFAMSVGMRVVLRKRPGWEPLFERPRGRRFWIRYALSIAVLFIAVLILGIFVFESDSASMESGFMAATFAAAGAIFAWLAPPHNPVRYSIFVGSTFAAVILFTGLVSPALDIEVLFGSLALAAIFEALYRLLSPRRWLVR